jgi:NAD(P)H-hydrate epimerase
MKIVTVSEMVAIEKASDAAGHSYDAMMELAGRAVAAALLRHMYPWDSTGSVLVLVGPGNNGGDGLVAARYLHQWQPQRLVTVYCWKRDPADDDNYEAVRRLRLPIVHAEQDPDFAQLRDMALEADVIVDALLGTGVSRPIGGVLVDLLMAVQQGVDQRRQEEMLAVQDTDAPEPASAQSAALALQAVGDFDFLRLPTYAAPSLPQVVAVDCPSGLNCDTGALDPSAMRADLTVTFANPKMGHFTADGPAACGRLEVADIGVDPDLAAGVAVQIATPALVKTLLPARPPDAHKGAFGKVMIVAGSANYTGAAYLAAAAAYRVGAGLVTLGVVSSLHPILAAGLTEATWLLLPEAMGVLSPDAVKVLLENVKGYAALLVGPGLTQEKEAVQFVQRLLGIGGEGKKKAGFLSGAPAQPIANRAMTHDQREQPFGIPAKDRTAPSAPADLASLHLPLVIDADALNALAQSPHWHEHLPSNAILTPHPGEMARLCDCTTADVRADRLRFAQRKATEWNQIVLVKGAYSVIAAPDGRTTVLPFANPALATAGSGDVLAGAIAGALAQGLAPFEAAVLGGYLHGLAGELARLEIGAAGVVAGDLLPRLPAAIRQLRAA